MLAAQHRGSEYVDWQMQRIGCPNNEHTCNYGQLRKQNDYTPWVPVSLCHRHGISPIFNDFH